MSPTSMKSLLLVENNPADALLLHEMFSEEGASVTDITHVRSLREAEQHLAERPVDIILLDLDLPDAQSLGAVRRAQAAAPRIPLVVLSALDDEALAIQVLQEGTQDYLVKGHFETRGLLRALRYAIKRKVREAALTPDKERAQVTLSCIGDAVACTDTRGRITYLNLRAEQLSGWSWQEAAGKGMGEVFRILDATSREAVVWPSTGIVVGDDRSGGLPSNSILIRRDGVEIPVEDSTAPIRDSQGHESGEVIVLRDVSAARTSAFQVARSAQHDFLTGLPNRVLLQDRVNHVIMLSQRRLKNIAVMFLDLDGFKHINDSLGHSVGDKLLQSVAARLVDSLRGSDTVSRQGGDEFIVLLSEVEHSADAAITARRMLKAVAESHPIGGHDLRVTASIGVSVYPDDGLDAETLIKNADTAMYQAKSDGRQRYRFFKPAMNVRAVQRQFIEEGLRCALESHEFELHYQPKVNLKTGTIVAVEALLRWMHPTRGPISPAQFIPVAEDCGLIVPIGHWVLREAARQGRTWLDLGLPLATMAVNISGVELRHDDFLEAVFAVLADARLDPRFLELELTENALMKNAEATEAVLKVLRAKGVRLAVDDFGVGYSSLNSLKRFSVDTLKIDPSFVRQIAAPSDQTTIVAATINMARSLNLRVVAEGVETQEELLFLQDHKCDEAQGYYFNRPVPPQQFARLLETGLSPTVLKDFVPSVDARESLSARARGLPGASDGSTSPGEIFGDGSVEHLARIDEMHTAEIAMQTVAHVRDIAERKTVDDRSRLAHERLEHGARARTTAVADRKLADANAATEQSEASFRLLVNGVRDYGLYMLDPTGHVVSWNVGAERITGYKADEILGKHLAVFFEEADAKNGRPQKRLLEAERTGRAEEEGRRVRKDGSTFWASVVLTPVCDASGVLLGFSKITHDLTERRNLEDQLQQSQKMEAIGSLAGGVAHDFNNLLSVVLSYSEMLAADLNESDPLRAGLEEIRNAGWRAVDLTKQLLAFSRQQVLQPKVVDLNDIVTGMEKMLRRLIGEDVDLTSTCASTLGKVLVDPGQVEQVIMNLAVNARDAMPDGGSLTIGTAEVFLDDAYAAEHAGIKAGPHVVLSMSDTGIGVDKATQARMFEPFFTTKPAGKGTGLGLSTVFGIVKQSGGTVAVSSELQKGTTFKIYLPLANRVAIVRGSSPPAGRDGLHGCETILLVEDDERVRVLARTILRKYGYDVLEAQSGGDALLLCEQHTATIHLLLTDVVMPLMSGRQLAERLATMRPEMKVVYMSGYTNDAVVRHGILTSTIMFIQKPITPEALARKVREALGAGVRAEA